MNNCIKLPNKYSHFLFVEQCKNMYIMVKLICKSQNSNLITNFLNAKYKGVNIVMKIYLIRNPEDISKACASVKNIKEQLVVLKFHRKIEEYKYTEINSLIYEFVHVVTSVKKTYFIDAELPHEFNAKDISRLYCLLSIRNEYALIDQSLSRIYVFSDYSVVNRLCSVYISKNRAIKEEALKVAVASLTKKYNIDAGVKEVFNSIRLSQDNKNKGLFNLCYKVTEINNYSAFALNNFNEIVSSVNSESYSLHWYILLQPWLFRYEVENSRIGWEKAWLYTKKLINEINIDFLVNIPYDKSLEESDVTNLKYMYPILDTLNNRSYVHIEYEKLSDEDEKFRISAFLYKSQKYLEYVLINGTVTLMKKAVSDIFPILSVNYKNYTELKLPYEVLKNNKKQNAFSETIDEYIMWINKPENYVGFDDNRIYQKDKEKIRNSIVELINEEKWNMSSLSFAVLVFLVRNLIDKKTLFDIEKKECNTEIFNKLCVDADSYAEGVYQIIENACLYSHGHKAFFCMRLHKTDKDAIFGNGAYEKESLTRVRLYNKYHHIEKVLEKNNKKNSVFSESKYKYFLEISVFDESTEEAFDVNNNEEIGLGIVQCFNSNNKIETHKVTEIENILDMTEENYKLLLPENTTYNGEFYWKHYGLRWFSRVVSKNKGLFFVLSPDDEGAKCYPNVDKSHFVRDGVYSTEYSIILPMSYEWDIDVNVKPSVTGEKLFDTAYLEAVGNDEISVRKCNIVCKIDGGLLKENDKIKEIYDELNQCNAKNGKDCIYIDVSKWDFCYIEALAKAIFRYIFSRHNTNSKQKNNPINIAVDFGQNNKCVFEFVRIFTIFYEKIGTNEYMDKVQIALCTDSTPNNEKGVCFLIAGKNIDSSYKTANMFVYYNSEYTLEYIPLLKFFSGNVYKSDTKKPDTVKKTDTDESDTNDSDSKNKDAVAVSQYPFDLVLNNKNEECFFIERMKRAINTDISKDEYGCRIENTHVRISSRIHLGTFYQAELLLQNVGNIYRFAYLIAGNIQREIKQNGHKKILIVGYEEYSVILMQQIQVLLKKTLLEDIDVYTTVISTANNGTNKINYFPTIPTIDKNEIIYVYTVIPIGTTMSTIYKLHNIIKNELRENKLVFCENHSLIVVGHYLVKETNDTSEKSDIDIVKCYWNEVNTKTRIIKVKPENKGKNESNIDEECISVKYYLVADSIWQKAEECKWCKISKKQENPLGDYRPLIQVDKSSTLTDAIFKLEKARNNPINNDNYINNNKQLKALMPRMENFLLDNSNIMLPPMIYSHVYRGNNHYQFYFDFFGLTERNYSDIASWAREQAYSIPSDSFNVLLSPLDINNSLFLKIIIDNVFSSSLRFLHIDIANTYKEDARTKFKYISEEFKRIRQYNHSASINFYYVDDSILTGQNLSRGRMLMRMLLEESEVEYSDIAVFKKIFLLINRSSFDTINNYISDPKSNLHSYINLYFPSYNTSNNFCPACKITQRYELLRKRSVSISLANEFDRLVEKNNKRSSVEYVKWLENKIRTSHSYFAWLRIWLYGNNEEALNEKLKEDKENINNDKKQLNVEQEKIKEEIRNRISKIKTELVNYMKRFTEDVDSEKVLMNVSKTTLEEFFIENGIRGQDEIDYINLMKFIVTERAYLRLETMNEAYYYLLYSEEACNRGNDVNKTYDAIIELITNGINHCNSKYDKMERIISYIKVISREHLSSYYHIRCAIVRVMFDMLNCLFVKNVDSVNEKFKEIVGVIRNEPIPYHQYSLFKTLVHRLASLQFPDVCSEEMIMKTLINGAYENLISNWEKLTDDGKELTEVPTKETVVKNYIVSIKTATMLTKDDAACFKLLDQTNNLSDENKKTSKNGINTDSEKPLIDRDKKGSE